MPAWKIVEAIIFAAKAPVSRGEIAARLPVYADMDAAIAMLREHYHDRGITLVEIDGKFAFRTHPAIAPYMQYEIVERRKLGRAVVETLAIIAYHQPCTRAEIEDIRGVSVSKGTIDTLLDLEWIQLGKRRESPGRPVTFVVTPQFLDHFGLSALSDLPRLDELREAGILGGTAGVQDNL